MAELRQRYAQASEALALACEVAAAEPSAEPGGFRPAVDRLLTVRAAHEQAICGGGFEAVDRTVAVGDGVESVLEEAAL